MEEIENNIATFLDHVRCVTASKEDIFSKKKSEYPKQSHKAPRKWLFMVGGFPAVLHMYLSTTRGPGIPLLL